MVILRYLLIFLILNISQLHAAKITLKTSKDKYWIGDNIIISIEVKDTKVLTPPDFSILTSSGLKVRKQRQQLKSVVIDNELSSSIVYDLLIQTDKVGEIEIPEIAIETSDGVLKTEVKKILVSGDQDKEEKMTDQVKFEAFVETLNPYVNQSFLYIVRITRFININKKIFYPPKSEDFIIEDIFEPQITDKIIDNRRTVIEEYKYLVTPIKSGDLTIEPSVLKGEYLVEKETQDNFLSFGHSEGSIYRDYQQFTFPSKKFNFKVKEKQYSDSKWLPLEYLQVLTESKIPEKIKKGDAVELKITLKGYNVRPELLPDIEFQDGQNYKIYSESPDLKIEIGQKSSRINATKTMRFTIIPTESGEIKIAPRTIYWWDVKNSKKRAIKTREIKFVVEGIAKPTAKAPENKLKDQKNYPATILPTKSEPEIKYERNPINMWLIISNIILASILLIDLLPRITGVLSKKQKNNKPAAKPKEKNKTAKDLYNFYFQYFEQNHSIKEKNLNDLNRRLKEKFSEKSLTKVIKISKKIESSIYGKVKYQKSLEQELKSSLKLLKPKSPKNLKTIKKIDLNPF